MGETWTPPHLSFTSLPGVFLLLFFSKCLSLIHVQVQHQLSLAQSLKGERESEKKKDRCSIFTSFVHLSVCVCVLVDSSSLSLCTNSNMKQRQNKESCIHRLKNRKIVNNIQIRWPFMLCFGVAGLFNSHECESSALPWRSFFEFATNIQFDWRAWAGVDVNSNLMVCRHLQPHGGNFSLPWLWL